MADLRRGFIDGDALIAFTDGLPEARNAQDEEFD
jgi:hypothetical protein